MRKWHWIALAGSVLIVAAAGAGFAAWRDLNAPLELPPEGASLEVAAGTALATVAADLRARQVLRHPQLLTWYARATGDATRIQAGEYRLTLGATARDLLALLVAGEVVLHRFTVVEGWRFVDLLTALAAHPAVDAVAVDGAAVMAALGKPGLSPEGQFLPDTYVFAKGTTDLEILRWAHAALVARLDAAWARRSPDSALTQAYDALILASIIEKETALPAERRLISGVFHARLQRGMRLQTDPTVIYGLGEEFDGNLRRRDLERDTPYNTYTRGGLPPTPIALAGAAAIDAAVDPEFSGALYFVATGNPDGSHHFSATYEEHNEAVNRMLLNGSP